MAESTNAQQPPMDEVSMTIKLLEEGEDFMDYNDEVVLVIGNSGSGKSAFVQYMAADNSKLISEASNGRFIIKGETISEKLTESCTKFPALFSSGSLHFYDCPGFKDSRHTSNDIAATYFIKKVLDKAKRIKLVLVSDYSLIMGAERSNFVELLKHTSLLVKNAKKFSGAIFLTATRVLEVDFGPTGMEMRKTEKIIENISQSLLQIRGELESSNRSFEGNDQMRFNALAILDALVLKEDAGKLSQLLVFRSPHMPGPLDKIDLMVEEKKIIQRLLARPSYMASSPTDFGYSLSSEARQDISAIVKKINDAIFVVMQEISVAIQARIESETAEGSRRSIVESSKWIRSQVELLKQLVSDLAATRQVDQFIGFVESALMNMDLGSSFKQKIGMLMKRAAHLDFLQDFSTETLTSIPAEWIREFVQPLDMGRKLDLWWQFLINLYKELSAHTTQVNRKLYNVRDVEDWGRGGTSGIFITTSNYPRFVQRLSQTFFTSGQELPNVNVLNENRQAELNELLKLTLRKDLAYDRSDEEKLIVKGNIIRLAEVTELANLPVDTKLKQVKFFATDRIYVDCSLDLPGIDVSLIAPSITVNGARKISLKAHEHGPHKSSRPEVDGKPAEGSRGGDGGSFLAVTTSSLQGLSVDVRGANGQDGQQGSNGAPGKNGQDAEFQRTPTSNIVQVKPRVTGVQTIYRIKPVVTPSEGGKGGKGGRAGNGGDAGSFFATDDGVSKEDSLSQPGKRGPGGNGGLGGLFGRNRLAGLEMHWIGPPIPSWEDLGLEAVKPERTTSGEAGDLGDAGKAGERIDKTSQFMEDVCFYKLYSLENDDSIFIKHLLANFNEQVLDSAKLDKLNTMDAFYREMITMEKEYHRFNLRLLPYYRSMLDKVLRYANNPDSQDMKTEQGKKSIQTLYAAVLGKVCCIERGQQPHFVVNIREHMKMTLAEIRSFKERQYHSTLMRRKQEFGADIKKRIAEAKVLMDTQVATEIDSLIEKTRQEVLKLIEEVSQLEHDYEEQQKALKKLEIKLQVLAALSIFKGVGKLLNLAGPYGAAANVVIQGSCGIAESFIDVDESPLQVEELPKGVAAFDEISEQLREAAKKRADSLIGLVTVMLTDVATYKPDEKEMSVVSWTSLGLGSFSQMQERLTKVVDMVRDVKTELDKAKKSKDKSKLAVLEKKLDKAEDEVQEVVEKESKEVEKDKKSSDPEKKKVATLKEKLTSKFGDMAKVYSVAQEAYDDFSGAMEKVGAARKAGDKVQQRLVELAKFKRQVRETMLPMVDGMGDDLKRVQSQLAGKSQVVLDVARWKVQGKLREMKRILEKSTAGFDVQDEFGSLIDQLSEAMTTQIGLFDRIEAYKREAEFADYIASMNNHGFGIESLDNKLGDQVRELRLAIQFNLVLDRYQECVSIFKQWVFPFACKYLNQFELPKRLETDESVDSFIERAVIKIESLDTEIKGYYSSIQAEDRYVRDTDFGENNSTTDAFYRWEEETHSDTIRKLMRGEEVFLLADVAQAFKLKAAIKFNRIKLNFKAVKEADQANLYAALKQFDLNLTHLGNSYYRFRNRVYVMESNEIPMVYSLSSESKLPADKNNVINKLASGDLLLSPYGMWKIQLTKTSNFPKADFQQLRPFVGKVNLELTGHANYIDETAKKIPDFELDTYYSLDRVLTGFQAPPPVTRAAVEQ